MDLKAAVETEIRAGHRVTPSRIEQGAVRDHVDDFVRLLDGQLRHGLRLDPAEILQVSKPNRGLRPSSLLSLSERVIYRALVSLLETRFPATPRTWEQFDAFQRTPLKDPSVALVVMADVASYYFFIDHTTLENEIVAQTGDSVLAECISTFLKGVMGRHFGLPQSYHSSDVLADMLIDIPLRQLLRDGFVVACYNDDFRVGVADWRGAQHLIARLDEALRELGLTLNDEKTHVMTRDAYDEWVAAPDAVWDQIADQVEVDFRPVDLYTALISDGEWDEDEETDEGDVEEGVEGEETPDPETLVDAAQRALPIWEEMVTSDTRDPLDRFVARSLLMRALATLGGAKSSEGLDTALKALDEDPVTTVSVSIYLQELARGGDQEGVRRFFQEMTSDLTLHISPWQAIWLIHPLFSLDEIDEYIRGWLRSLLVSSTYDSLTSRAALALAAHRAIEPEDLATVFDSVRKSSRPDLVAGLAALCADEDPLLQSVESEEPINQWIIERVRESGGS